MVTTTAEVPDPLGRDSTIYVLSRLPVDICDEILQAITVTKHSFHDNDTIPWHIQNRYYSADVQFKLMDSPEHLLGEIQTESDDEAETPAVMLVVDSSEDLEETLLERIDTSSIDLPLVVGKPGSSKRSRNTEDNMELCLRKGYEYIDLADTDEDDAGGQTGLARLSEALQAHIWPNSQMAPRIRPTAAALWDDEAPSVSQRQKPSPAHQRVAPANVLDKAPAGTASGFDDDFPPFVSSASSQADLDDTNIGAEQDDDEDGEDPAVKLTAMFSSLVGMREQALAMPDNERRKDFAADMALKFARQLDAMLGEESDDVDVDRQHGTGDYP